MMELMQKMVCMLSIIRMHMDMKDLRSIKMVILL